VITRIRKWGNSHALRISKQMLSDIDVEAGDAVEVVVRDGALVVTPVRRVRGALQLEDLVEAIDTDYTPAEVDWGPPVGKEVW
jgi:antitoxin MazE